MERPTIICFDEIERPRPGAVGRERHDRSQRLHQSSARRQGDRRDGRRFPAPAELRRRDDLLLVERRSRHTGRRCEPREVAQEGLGILRCRRPRVHGRERGLVLLHVGMRRRDRSTRPATDERRRVPVRRQCAQALRRLPPRRRARRGVRDGVRQGVPHRNRLLPRPRATDRVLRPTARKSSSSAPSCTASSQPFSLRDPTKSKSAPRRPMSVWSSTRPQSTRFVPRMRTTMTVSSKRSRRPEVVSSPSAVRVPCSDSTSTRRRRSPSC